MARIPLILVAAFLAAAPAAAQDFSAERLDRHVRTLSHDSFEGRGPATAGETKTVDYLVRELRAAGVQPGGELVNGRRQWTQRVPLLQSDWTGDPLFTLRTARGETRLAQGTDIAARAPLNGTDRLRIANAPLVFAGYGVSAPERQWDDFKDVDVRGKILVVLINDPDFEGAIGDGGPDFGGKAMTYYGRWTYKYEEAARRGAVGVMIVHEDAPASYGWATVRNSNTNTMFDVVRQNPTAAHPPMESWISRASAERLFADAGLDFDAAKAAARRRDFRPVDLRASFSASAEASRKVITSFNVVGLRPGVRRPNETVIFTAHHDHIGVGEPDENGDRIYNGAIDNATGVAHVLEQARAFARGPATDRSLVFLFVGAEEKGLLGSEYYVSNPLYPLETTVGVLNTDSMGVNGRARNFSAAGAQPGQLHDWFVAVGEKQGRTFTPDARPEAGSFFRSDHFPFAKRGVPAISFRSGNDLEQGGTERGNALSADYTARRYHQQDDEWQPGWNYAGIIQDGQLLHNLARALADSADWPNWGAGSEFRDERDASASARGASAPAATPARAGERG